MYICQNQFCDFYEKHIENDASINSDEKLNE